MQNGDSRPQPAPTNSANKRRGFCPSSFLPFAGIYDHSRGYVLDIKGGYSRLSIGKII